MGNCKTTFSSSDKKDKGQLMSDVEEQLFVFGSHRQRRLRKGMVCPRKEDGNDTRVQGNVKTEVKSKGS